jgi:hypothetical protein
MAALVMGALLTGPPGSRSPLPCTLHPTCKLFPRYPSDDINKFLWMVRIGGGEFPEIKERDYIGDGSYRVDNKVTKVRRLSRGRNLPSLRVQPKRWASTHPRTYLLEHMQHPNMATFTPACQFRRYRTSSSPIISVALSYQISSASSRRHIGQTRVRYIS